MVTMSSGFTLPPVIRRFGRCGEWEHGAAPSSASSVATESLPAEYQSPRPSRYGGAPDRVKSFVNGIVSPFAACLQPTDAACAPGCTSDRFFEKRPSIVSPHFDRVIAYRDRAEAKHDHDDYYTRRHPRHHPHRSPSKYHQHPNSQPVSSPTYPPRREPAAVEETETKQRSTDIAKPRSNDILCGRGGSSNRHLGNIHFRELVAANKQIYVGLTKKQKMLVARKIVDAIHNTGGRFLAKDLDTGMFYDIGLPRSLEKTSQALREKHSNEMPVSQPVEDEGIETSVESHKSLIKSITSTDGSKGSSEESPSETSSKSSSSSKKVTEAPDLIIPPHLTNKFGPKGAGAGDEDWENKHPHTMSPRSYHSEPSYERSPYPPSPYRTPSGSSPPKGYGHPPPHHRHPRYPASPVPSGGQYPHPHYYYPPPPPQTPPYGRRGPDERYAYPPYDDREAYNSDYYKRAPHSQYHRYPRHHPRGSPPSRGPPPPGYGSSLPSYRPSSHSYYHHAGEPPSPSSRIIYRNTNNGYIRGNSDVSPERQRELKRPRNDATRNDTTSDASLSCAVKQSLSLDDRVVGKEREKLQKEQIGKNRSPLVSPSSMLQTKSFSRGSTLIESDRSSPTEKKEDYSGLSGLAALSTAAFLKLDEDDDVK